MVHPTQQNVQSKIANDLRDWSASVLEVSNEYLKGLPACPYAKKAWQEDKVKIVESDSLVRDSIKEAKAFKANKYELIVVASYEIPDLDLFNSNIEKFNDRYIGLHFMGFHPEYGAEDAELDFLYDHDWVSDVEEEYCMIFIQCLIQVDNASLKLEKLGYYDAYPKEEYETLVLDRREKRQWL